MADRRLCLDMMKVTWEIPQSGKRSDCAILMEIDSHGGLLQTTQEIPSDGVVRIETSKGSFEGHVTSCEHDAYGYLVDFLLEENSSWYPKYCPELIRDVH